MAIVPDCEQITSELNELKMKIAKTKARRNAQIDLLQRNLLGSSPQIGTYNSTKPRTYYSRLYSNDSLAYPWRSLSLESLLVDKYYESPSQRYKHLDDVSNRLKGSTNLNLNSPDILSKLKDFVLEQEREATNNLLRRIDQSRNTSYNLYPYRSHVPISGRYYQPVLPLVKKEPPFLNPINKKDNFYKRYNTFMKKILKPSTVKSKLTDDYAVADGSRKYRYSSRKYHYDDLYYDPYYKWPRWYHNSSSFARNRYDRRLYDYNDYDYKGKLQPAIVPRDVDAIIYGAKSKYGPKAAEPATKRRSFSPIVPPKYDNNYDPYESDSYSRTGLPNWKQYYYTQKLKSKPSHLRFRDDYYDPYLDFFRDDASTATSADGQQRLSFVDTANSIDEDVGSPPDVAEKLVDRYRDAIYEDIIRNLREKQSRKPRSKRLPATVTKNYRNSNDCDPGGEKELSSGLKYESNRGISPAMRTRPVTVPENEPQNGDVRRMSSIYSSTVAQGRVYPSSAAAVYKAPTENNGKLDSTPPREKYATSTSHKMQQPSRYSSMTTSLPNENTRPSVYEPSTILDRTESTTKSESKPFDSNKNSATKMQSLYYTTPIQNQSDNGQRSHYVPHQTAVDYSAPMSYESTRNELSATREKSPLRYERPFFGSTNRQDSHSPEHSSAEDGAKTYYSRRSPPIGTKFDATKYRSQSADKTSYSQSSYSNIDYRSDVETSSRPRVDTNSPPTFSQSAQNHAIDLSARHSSSSQHGAFSGTSAPRNESIRRLSSSFEQDDQSQPSVTAPQSQAAPSKLESQDSLKKWNSRSSFANETTTEDPEKISETTLRRQSTSSTREREKSLSRHSSATKVIADVTPQSTDELPRRESSKELDKDIQSSTFFAKSNDRDVVDILERDGTVPNTYTRQPPPPPLTRRNSVKPLLRKASFQSTTNSELTSDAMKPIEAYSIEEESNEAVNYLPEQTAVNVQNSESRSHNIEPYHGDDSYYDNRNAYDRDYNASYESHGQYVDRTGTNQNQLEFYHDGNYNNAYSNQAYGDYTTGYYDQNAAAYGDYPATAYAGEQSADQYANQNYVQQEYVDGYSAVATSNEPREVEYSLASVDENKSQSLNDDGNLERDVADGTIQDTVTNSVKTINRKNSIVSKELVRKPSRSSSSAEEKKLSAKTSSSPPSQPAELQKRTSKPKIGESRFRRAASTVKNNARAPAKKT